MRGFGKVRRKGSTSEWERERERERHREWERQREQCKVSTRAVCGGGVYRTWVAGPAHWYPHSPIHEFRLDPREEVTIVEKKETENGSVWVADLPRRFSMVYVGAKQKRTFAARSPSYARVRALLFRVGVYAALYVPRLGGLVRFAHTYAHSVCSGRAPHFSFLLLFLTSLFAHKRTQQLLLCQYSFSRWIYIRLFISYSRLSYTQYPTYNGSRLPLRTSVTHRAFIIRGIIVSYSQVLVIPTSFRGCINHTKYTTAKYIIHFFLYNVTLNLFLFYFIFLFSSRSSHVRILFSPEKDQFTCTASYLFEKMERVGCVYI